MDNIFLEIKGYNNDIDNFTIYIGKNDIFYILIDEEKSKIYINTTFTFTYEINSNIELETYYSIFGPRCNFKCIRVDNKVYYINQDVVSEIIKEDNKLNIYSLKDGRSNRFEIKCKDLERIFNIY